MEFDLSSLPAADHYRLLSSVVVPRPIAWVTTRSVDGTVNAAPFSFFNVLGSSPAVVALGIGEKSDGSPKDTRRNIVDTGEFVVNLVTFAAREAMNGTSVEAPADASEVEALGLETLPSVRVGPPRLAISPVHLECRLHKVEVIGDNHIVLGEVVHLHIDDAFYDTARRHVATERMDLIARMHGRGGYLRATDLFEMPRPAPGTAPKR
jgi:flavin reductase (DIM6/NTAB) family NADH-FMN oxidoreductase RutF